MLGHDVASQPGMVRRVIGLSGQYAAVDGYLTGRENLRMMGRLSGLGHRSARRRATELLDQFDLIAAADRTARTYSGGMRRRLDVAASLVTGPTVLFLDEPTTGLDPRGRLGLWRLIAQLTDQGATVLLTTQYLEEADRLADSIVVLDQGRVIAAGTAEQLKTQVGGDRLELQAPPGRAPGRADGPAILPELAARLAHADLRVSDLALRRPSLDDVFLALTGQTTAPSTRDIMSVGSRR